MLLVVWLVEEKPVPLLKLQPPLEEVALAEFETQLVFS